MVRSLIINVIALFVATLLPGIEVMTIPAAVIFIFVLTLLNVTVGLLLKVAGFIANLFTFGIFNFIVNIGMVMLAAHVVEGVYISSWWAGLMVAGILAFANAIANGSSY